MLAEKRLMKFNKLDLNLLVALDTNAPGLAWLRVLLVESPQHTDNL